MSKKYTFAVVGGDHRQVVIIKKLLMQGHYVKVFSLGAPIGDVVGAEISSSIERALSGCDVLLLPLPLSRDGTNINLTSSSEAVGIADVIKLCSKNKGSVIIGGLISGEVKNAAQAADVEIIDYYESEELQQKNALPSAEGTIMVAMENTDRVIEGMRVLICGYGRIGKILADKLKLLGAAVSVAARRDEVLCEIAMCGFTPVDLRTFDELANACNTSEVILNTIPRQIFTRRVIDKTDNAPLYIEVASSPGGIDIPCARSRGLRLVFAPSLPGKYAPASAGEYIFETIKDILSKRGMKI